jgi:hypothetical protein
MHTLTEDAGNDIPVNQYICARVIKIPFLQALQAGRLNTYAFLDGQFHHGVNLGAVVAV